MHEIQKSFCFIQSFILFLFYLVWVKMEEAWCLSLLGFFGSLHLFARVNEESILVSR